MMRLSCILIFSFLSTMAAAEGLLVSMGQSASATRIVLTFQSRPKWSVVRSSDRFELVFETEGYSVDAPDFQDIVTSPRIASISSDDAGGKLSIDLSCTCETDVYPFGDGSLIIEIRDPLRLASDGQDLDTAPKQPPIPIPSDESRSVTTKQDAPVSTSRPAKPGSPEPEDQKKAVSEPLAWRPLDLDLGWIETLGFDVSRETTSQAVEMISRELSRAASQGLIAAGSDPEFDRGSNRQGNGDGSLANRSNLKIQTSLDRAIAPNRDLHPPTRAGTVCFSDSEVDVAAWSGDAGINEIGRLRRDAFGENGEVTHEGGRNLARYYISLGFGSEALTATHFMADGKSKQILEALAEIVDHGASDINILDGQIYCDGQVALWAALARPIGTGVVPESTNSILSTFSGLAPHHRAHLGPVLAERLREVGLDDEARNAVNAVVRGGLQSNESELVTARLELEGTRPELARDSLVEISNGTDVTAAEALLELLEDAERREMNPNPTWVEDAPSLARATEGNEVATLLNLAGLRGRISLGQYDELRLALAEDTPGLDRNTRRDLAVSGVVSATRNAEDGEFLRTEIAFSKLFEVQDINSSDRFLVAQKLSAIGLASRAQKYLVDGPQTTEEVVIASDIFLANGRNEEAVDLLSTQNSADAVHQLGRILSRVGKNGPATQAFEDGGFIEEAAQSALRAGDWSWIAERNIEGSSGALSDAARTLSSPLHVLDSTEDPGNGRLIVSSQILREHAQSLLSETELSKNREAFTN